MAKNRRVFICLLLFIWGMAAAFQPTSLEKIYVSQLGVVERPVGSNYGKEVGKYLAHVKFKTPAPWCAAFVRFCLDSAGIKSTVTAYSPTAQNTKDFVWRKGKWIKAPQPGDVFTIYYPSMGRIAHTGFYHRSVNKTMCETVEGNTNPGGGREGYGVFRRKRSFNSLYSISRWR